MPETPEDFYDRVRRHQTDHPESMVPPSIAGSEISPYEPATLRVRPLVPPLLPEPPRGGAGGENCSRCATGDADAIWSDGTWMLVPLGSPAGIPWAGFLLPFVHADLGDLDDDLAAGMGRLLAHLDRAVMQLGHIGRLHVHRWGDGGEHFHLWLLARPYGQAQLRGTYLQDWMSILPPVPEDQWWADQHAVAQALASSYGGTPHPRPEPQPRG